MEVGGDVTGVETDEDVVGVETDEDVVGVEMLVLVTIIVDAKVEVVDDSPYRDSDEVLGA